MTQEIKIEVDDHNFTREELKAISQLSLNYPHQNIRVSDDETNIKIYVGLYYLEKFRYWYTPDGHCHLVEEDISDPEDDEAIWKSVDPKFAYDNLSIAHI